MKKTITFVMTLVLVFVFSMTSFASNLGIDGENFIVANLTENLAGVKFDLINKDILINYDIQQLDTDTIKVSTVVEMGDGTTEKHTGIYNTKDSIFILDGEEMHIEKSIFTKPMNFQRSEMPTPNSSYSWNYKYTYSLSFDKIVTTIGAIATIIGGVIAGAALAGVSIAKSTISSTIANWAGVVGLGSLVSGWALDGEVTFDLYETSIPIDTGYGSKQYGYRYQDIGANFRIKGFRFSEVFLGKGSTWFASKPY